jgi:hypothetical protein
MTTAGLPLRSTRRALAALALACCMLATGSALAQVAGKVVLAVGDVVAVRGGERVRLAGGAAISVGDAIVTGPQSHAQLRFSDAALVALKPESEFRIETFAFTGEADGSERAVFRLVRGGFRTVTGSIGLVNKDRYQVLTTQATIGIRGTHYTLQSCATGQCVTGGETAPAGLYGGVFDGIVAVSNAFRAEDYVAGEYFFVPDDEPPQRRISPPDFLSSRLEGRGRAEVPAPAQLRFSSVPESALPPALPEPPFTYMVTEDRNLLTLQLTRGIVVGSDRYTLELDTTKNPAVALGLDSAGRMTSFANGALTANLGGAAIVDTGSDGTVADLNWGRWEGKDSTIVQRLPDGSTVNNNGGNLHYIYGNLSPSLPSSGQFTYVPVGGTRPTDSATGATGTLVSGGTINVDFGVARLALTGLTVGFTNATYTMSGTTGITNGLFSTSGAGASVGCAGIGCRPLVAGNFAGFFAGPSGAGIGLDYFFNTRGGGVLEGVAGYRKCAGGGPC